MASCMHARARGVEISTYALKFPRQPDDGQYRPKHAVVSITVIKYTSVIKLCLTTYVFLVSHTHNGDDSIPRRSTCFRRVFRPSSAAQNCTYSVRPLLLPAASLARLAAGSSIGLTNT